MSSLIKRKDNRFWVACFRDHNKKQHRRSTRETNRKQAQFIADKYELAARGGLMPHKAREIFAELYRRFSGDAIPTSSVEDFVTTWLGTKIHEISPKSLVAYRVAAEEFLKCLGELAKKDLAAITRQHLVEYRNSLAARLRPNTVNGRLTIVKLIFRAARRDGYLSNDPSEFVESVRNTEKDVREAFTIEEIRAVLKVADDEWVSMILFGAYTAQRLGDISALTWNNIDLEKNEIRLVTQKTGKRLIIPIADPLRVHIESLPSSDDPGAPIHPRAFRQYTISKASSNASFGFAKLLVAAGLRDSAEDGGRDSNYHSKRHRLTFHSLRHFAVSWLKDAGVPQATVQEFVGHSSVEMSAHYTHVGLPSLRQAANKFPDIRI
jgi:integrase